MNTERPPQPESRACDPELLEVMVESLREPDRPLEASVVLIPVAAAQDSALIYPALEQYAQSEKCLPFTIALNLNQPADVERDWIHAAQAEVDRAKEDFPLLDIRTIHRRYKAPTIGEIRADLWDAAVRLADEESPTGKPALDYIGYNHDIDLMRLPKRFMSAAQMAYYTKPHTAVVATAVRHNRTGEFPYADRATALYDFMNTGVARAAYEAGLIIPFEIYKEYGGFLRDTKTHETRVFSDGSPYTILSAPPLYTSPRRLIERIGAGAGIDTLWTEETFGAHNTCRDPSQLHDITPETLRAFSYSMLDSYYQAYIEAGAISMVTDKIITDETYRSEIYTLDPNKRDAFIKETFESYHDTRRALAERGLRLILD